MDYKKAPESIKKNARGDIVPGLSRIKKLLKCLGDPQDDLRIVHIAGTNGKGSVGAFMESALRDSNLNVARYISPEIFDYRERFQYNGRCISKKLFSQLAEKVTEISLGMEDTPTTFEMETAIAFLFAAEKNCDIMLLETGMGGRYDATNTVKAPLLSVITAISMDHMDYLGNDIKDIAYEKAGIIKRKVPVVSSFQNEEAEEILKRTALEKGTDILFTKESDIEGPAAFDDESFTQRFSYKGEIYETSLLGRHQAENGALAVEALNVLKKCPELHIDDGAIKKGLKKACWPGRFQRIGRGPDVIIDGAHNPAGARALKAAADMYLKGKTVFPVMGVFKDKDHKGILREMKGISDSINIYKAPGERGLPVSELKRSAEGFFQHVRAFDDPEDAVDDAVRRAEKDHGAVLIFGTLSTIGEIYAKVAEK